MLKLTKRADYGMMAMRYLAEHANRGKAYSARDIADAYDIPLPVLAKTLQTLTRARLVVSRHGALGGYALARPAESISTLDVISAFDGPPVITSCSTIHGNCEMASRCKVREPLRRVNDGIRTLLTSISIADLTEPEEGLRIHDADRLVHIHD